MHLLLTGSTGALGPELLTALATARPHDTLRVVLRASSDEELAQRTERLKQSLDCDIRHRVEAVRGDVTADGLGLGAAYDVVATETDEIFHAAACTRFDAGPGEATAHNVIGTRHVIDLARAARRAGRHARLHYVSTAYVAGRRTGLVSEDDLDCGQQFFNAYEWSKFQAECDVRSASDELPVTIYRPSVVVGHSLTGCAHRFLGLYQVLRWIDRGQVAALPCRADFELDIVPADYVAEAIVRLSLTDASIGRTFHLTAGARNRLPLATLIQIFLHEREARGRAPVSAPVFDAARPVDPDARINPYVPYLTCDKTFDDRQTRTLLAQGPAPCLEFFPRVARYALDSQFRAA